VTGPAEAAGTAPGPPAGGTASALPREEGAIGVKQKRAIPEIVVSDFVPGIFDPRHQLRVTKSAFADEEKGGLGVVSRKDVEYLRREDRMRTVIKRQGNQRTIGRDPVEEVGSAVLDRTEDARGSAQKTARAVTATTIPRRSHISSGLTSHLHKPGSGDACCFESGGGLLAVRACCIVATCLGNRSP